MRLIDLKPSLLILHDVKLRGGIQYKVLERSEEMDADGKQERAEWKTERIIYDKAEFDAARALRARCETLLQTTTGAARSDIGLFAPDTPQTFAAIEQAEAEITAMIDEFKRDAYFNELYSRVITFRIQSDNRQALEAVAEMISDGLSQLKEATAAADPKAIRAALKNMRGLDKLLPDQKSDELKSLIDTMREKARKLTKEINKQGRAITDDEVIKLMDTAALDRAQMVIFETEPTDTETAPAALPAFDVDDFQIDDQPAAPDTTPTAATATVDDFQTDDTTETEPTPATAPARAAADLTPDATPEQERGADFQDDPEPVSNTIPDADAAPADLTERAAALIDAYERATSDAERDDIRAQMETLAAISL
ncbi:MAG: hypothetical protein BWY28_03133 [bacterium ADurb.Bin236]|nr:MAG: hypothetical protein BWY28_03133 [bacterium ADurb.Bin236]